MDLVTFGEAMVRLTPPAFQRIEQDAARFATATSALKHSIPGDLCLVTRGEVEQLLRGASLRVVAVTIG